MTVERDMPTDEPLPTRDELVERDIPTDEPLPSRDELALDLLDELEELPIRAWASPTMFMVIAAMVRATIAVLCMDLRIGYSFLKGAFAQNG
jgi:hypothetical protein